MAVDGHRSIVLSRSSPISRSTKVRSDPAIAPFAKRECQKLVYYLLSKWKLQTRDFSVEVLTPTFTMPRPKASAVNLPGTKLVPLSPDDKPLVRHVLQGAHHFETSLTAATAASSCGLTIPSWFVGKHGDKFTRSVVLRTESSTKRWSVRLSIWFPSQRTAQVKFCGGWLAFAKSNELLEGDSLIFVLTAMSNFKVYLFRGVGGEIDVPRRNRRRGTAACAAGGSKRKGKKPMAEWQGGPEGDVQGEMCTGPSADGRSNKKAKKTMEEWRGGRVDVREDRRGAPIIRLIDLNKEPIEADDTQLTPVPPPDTKDNVRHLPTFSKTLTFGNIDRSAGACLEFPEDFWKMHKHKIHSVVTLQGIHQQSPVRAMTLLTGLGQGSRFYLRDEWQGFVAENRLREGQKLIFTLAADSFFVVRERISSQPWA